MSIKNSLRTICHSNRFFSRQYDKLTWYKSRILCVIESDEHFAKRTYKEYSGKELHLNNPETFDEKIWYLKLHNRDPLMTQCTDKYAVREYVERCGLKNILNELIGVYDDARDIDFSSFTDPTFIKCNHCSGENLIYYPDQNLDIVDLQKRFNFLLRQNSYWKSREWNYKNIKPRIIAEKVLRDSNGDLPMDYKFMCFDGEPKLLFLDINVCMENGRHSAINYRNIYDMNFNLIDMVETREHKDIDIIKKPQNFEKMVQIARTLSRPFRHCRVDLYNVDGKIYFGEITFYHGGGYNEIRPESWDYKIGSWINTDNL